MDLIFCTTSLEVLVTNLEIKASVVRERIHLRPREMSTKVNVRIFRDEITLAISKNQIDKRYRE